MQLNKVSHHRLLFGGSEYAKTMGLNAGLVFYLWNTATQSPLINSIIDFAALWATTSPWTVEITSRSGQQPKVFSDDTMNKLFAMQCNSKLELIIQQILIFGFVGISYSIRDGVPRDQVTGADIILNVLHPYEFEPRFKYSKRGNRKWIAFTRSSSYVQTPSPIPYSRVFIFREPEPLTMRPTSALMATLRSVFQYEQAMALQEVVAHKRAFPVWVYKSEMDKLLFPTTDPTMPSFNRTDPSGAAEDIGLDKVDQEYLRDMSVRQALQNISSQVHQKAALNDDMMMQMYAKPDRDRDAAEDFIAKATEAPTMPSKLMAPGITMESNVPEPKASEHFNEVESLLKTQICAALGVPIELIFPQSTRSFAADANLSRKVMEIRTTRLHHWLGEVLQEVFLDIHMADLKKTVDSLSRYITANQLEKLEGKLDRDTMTRAGIMLKEQYRNAILQDMIVSVHFAESTSASEQSLIMDLTSGVIDHAKFQELMLATQGIPQSAKATLSKAQVKEIEEHIRFGQKKEAEQKPVATKGDSEKESAAKRQKTKDKPVKEK